MTTTWLRGWRLLVLVVVLIIVVIFALSLTLEGGSTKP
jgi:hypothetical protein